MSLPITLRFSLTNEDLLTAYNAQLDHVCKPPMRYAIIATGCLAILGPLVAFLCHIKSRLGLLDLALVSVGIVLLRAWVIAPIIKRREIHSEYGSVKMIRLIISEEAVTEESGDNAKAVHEWNEIDVIVEMPKGFIFYFHSEPLMWLPIRVFESEGTRTEFINLAGRKGKL